MAKRAKHHVKSRAVLPKRAPKRTGKRGINPVDDFDQPVKKEPEAELLVTPATPRKPRQARLPEMQDPQIEELEAAAEEYAAVRDERMALTPEETRLKTELLGLMKKNGRTSYVHDGFDIKVIVESEKVRVRIKKEDSEKAAAAAG